VRITRLGSFVKTSVRGEAVDFDKYEADGRPNPYHGWTLDFPDYVPTEERTYGNKARAQGWYDDPENQPLHPGTQWGGTGDYADKTFHQHTQQFNREHDPNREIMDPTGALGQYEVGVEDLNEYHPHGHSLHPGNQTGYPSNFTDPHGSRGVYSTRPDINPWPGMERQQDRELSRALSPSTHQYVMPTDLPDSIGEGSGHSHSEHDDLGNLDRVFGMWHGGSGYSYGDPREDMESFPSIEHAQQAVQSRYNNYNHRSHNGERTAYDPLTDTHHLVGNYHDASLDTPVVGRDSGMEIYHATADPNTGWHVHTEDEPAHHIWINRDGDAVVGRERGDYGDDEDYNEDYDDYDDNGIEEEEQGSHPKQQHLLNAGFGYTPHEYNGDRYTHEDHNGHTHVIRAPNPAYGAMDNWHYEFYPRNEGDRDPHAPDPSRDGPRPLSFQANSADEAYNLHQNIGNDLGELASRGWGTHKINLGDAGGQRDPRRRNTATPSHTIEALRRHADDNGMDRVVRMPNGSWAAAHVPDSTPEDPHPRVTNIAQSMSRREALDAADREDARGYLNDRAGYGEQDPESGHVTWQVPDRHMGSDQYNVTMPGTGAHNPRWTVTHKRNGRIVNHFSYPHWADARDYLKART